MLTRDERTAAISEAVASQVDPKQEKLWAKDQFRFLDVYSVPADALVMNPNNRRFRVDRLWAEEQLGRSLDPDSSPNDALSVESLLLDTSRRVDGDRIAGRPTDDTENLERDYVRRGQERPFWIRPDGRVRNGNRRLAMIRRLARREGDTGLHTVDAVVLSEEEYSEEDIFHMEAREQLTEGYKVRYSNINYLLHLREAAILRAVDWDDPESIADVAGTLQTEVEKSKREVERDLNAVKYMDDYLEELGSPEAYQKIPNTLEVFRAIGEGMARVTRDYPEDAAEALQVYFAAVKAGQPLATIRRLRAMQREDRSRFEELATEVDSIEELWEEQSPAPAHLPTPETLEQDGESQDEDPDGRESEVAADYPAEDVAQALTVAVDAFDTAGRDDVVVLLQQALSRLTTATSRTGLDELLATNEKAGAALAGIVEWVRTYRPVLADDDG